MSTTSENTTQDTEVDLIDEGCNPIIAFFENEEKIRALYRERREEAPTADECFLARWRMKNDTDDPGDVVEEINERREESDSSVGKSDVMFHVNHRCTCDHGTLRRISLRDCMRLRTMSLEDATDYFPNKWEYTVKTHWTGECSHTDLISPRKRS